MIRPKMMTNGLASRGFPWSVCFADLYNVTHLQKRLKSFVLGIETSCDDTGVAIVSSDKEIVSEVVISHSFSHETYGGVFPKIAGMQHSRSLPVALRKCIDDANNKGIDVGRLNAIAVTQGPGLGPCLSVGVNQAKAISSLLNCSLIGVHHMEAHALIPRLTEDRPIEFPYLSLLVSGGHTLIILTKDVHDHDILASTLDDAIGEAFDKVATMLGLPWKSNQGDARVSGGRAVEMMALQGDPHRFKFTVPMRLSSVKWDDHMHNMFSFAGLKAAVKREVEKATPLDDQTKADLAASFQYVAFRHLIDKLTNALTKHPTIRQVVFSGGVASNGALKNTMISELSKYHVECVFPPARYCVDNGVMIAWTGVEMLKKNYVHDVNIEYLPRWPLSDLVPVNKMR